MKLIVKCPKCKQINKAPHKVNNRIDYAKKYGDQFSLKCAGCNETTEFHVDEIKAIDYSLVEIIQNKLVIFIIVFVATIVLGFFLIGTAGAAALSVVSLLVSLVFAKKNNSSANLIFNKHKLKGRVSGVGFRK